MSQTLAPALPTASRQPNFGTLARNLFIAVVLTYPFLDLAFGWQALLAFIPMMLMITLAMGLNIVVGYAGLLDLGYAAFYAIGAYAAAFFTSPVSPLNAILPDSPFFWM